MRLLCTLAVVAFVAIVVSHVSADEILTLCYPYATCEPRLVMINPLTGGHAVAPAFDQDTINATSYARDLSLHHGIDNKLYLALGSSSGYFGSGVFVRRFDQYSANGLPVFNTNRYADKYFGQDSRAGLAQDCSSAGNFYMFTGKNNLVKMNFDSASTVRTGMRKTSSGSDGGYHTTNLAFDATVSTLHHLVLQSSWPTITDSWYNDEPSNGLYDISFVPSQGSTNSALQTGFEWDPNFINDNLEISQDGQYYHFWATWRDSNQWNSGIEDIVQYLETSSGPARETRDQPAEEVSEEQELREIKGRREALKEYAKKHVPGKGVSYSAISLNIPGKAAPGQSYNPFTAKQTGKVSSLEHGDLGSTEIEQPQTKESTETKESKNLSKKGTYVSPYLVTVDAATMRTVAIVDTQGLFCQALAHYTNPCNNNQLTSA